VSLGVVQDVSNDRVAFICTHLKIKLTHSSQTVNSAHQ